MTTNERAELRVGFFVDQCCLFVSRRCSAELCLVCSIRRPTHSCSCVGADVYLPNDESKVFPVRVRTPPILGGLQNVRSIEPTTYVGIGEYPLMWYPHPHTRTTWIRACTCALLAEVSGQDTVVVLLCHVWDIVRLIRTWVGFLCSSFVCMSYTAHLQRRFLSPFTHTSCGYDGFGLLVHLPCQPHTKVALFLTPHRSEGRGWQRSPTGWSVLRCLRPTTFGQNISL